MKHRVDPLEYIAKILTRSSHGTHVTMVRSYQDRHVSKKSLEKAKMARKPRQISKKKLHKITKLIDMSKELEFDPKRTKIISKVT